MTNPDDPILCTGTMEGHNGLTKREWYAGMALQGVMKYWLRIDGETLPLMARDSVRMANALIAELNKEKP